MYSKEFARNDAMPDGPKKPDPRKMKLTLTLIVMALFTLPCYYIIMWWILSTLNAPMWIFILFGAYITVGYGFNLYFKWIHEELEQQIRVDAVEQFKQDWYRKYGF